MAKLRILQGGEVGREFTLGDGDSVVGRSPDCDVILDVAAVSRHHATIQRADGRASLKDMGSRNGTYINGQRVQDSQALADGDQILICDVLFEYTAETPAGLVAETEAPSSLLTPRDALAAMSDGDDYAGDGTSSIMATVSVGRGGAGAFQLSAKPEAQLQAMVEISNNLSQTLSVSDILPKILDSLFKIFVQADRGFVVMRPKEDAPLVPVASKARRESDEENMRVSRTIVEQALSTEKAILSADASSDERFNMAQSIADFQIRSLICAPMIASNGDPLGVIQVDTRDQRSRFTDQDLHVLASVANQASVAMDNARMHEDAIQQKALQRDLELAHQMQLALLPNHSPTVPGYYFFEFYEAANQVGGDYYDYVMLPDDRVAIVLGDVAGKGVSAAIIMAKLSSDVRFWLAREPDAAKAMGQINAAFCQHAWDDRFVTMVVAIIDPADNKLTLVNAGHMPPMLRDSQGKVIEIGEEEAGLPIGVIDDFEYEAYERDLEPGDFLTAFTDGFSEAMNSNRDLFGIERLAELLSSREHPTKELGPYVLQEVRSFAGDFPQSDDMCLACFGRDAEDG
ncbi:MAG: SpoIIE family protein phosphatase [Planctomycetota bacterium]